MLKNRAFWGGLDDRPVLGIEHYQEDAIQAMGQVLQIRDSIEAHGLSVQKYDQLEAIIPGILHGIPRNKVTQNCSKTYACESLQNIDLQGFMNRMASTGIGKMFMDFIRWLGNMIRRMFGRTDKTNKDEHKATQNKLKAYDGKSKKNKSILEEYMRSNPQAIVKRVNRRICNTTKDTGITNVATTVVKRANVDNVIPLVGAIKYGIKMGVKPTELQDATHSICKSPLGNTHPIIATGLATSALGIPSRILLLDYLKISKKTILTIPNITKAFEEVAKVIDTPPRTNGESEFWVNKINHQIKLAHAKINDNSELANFVNRYNNDTNFDKILDRINSGALTYWHNSKSVMGGRPGFDPNKNHTVIKDLFDNATYLELDAAVIDTLNHMESILKRFDKVDYEHISKIVGSHNAVSAGLRESIRTLKDKLLILIRVTSLVQSYVDGCATAFERVNGFTKEYDFILKVIT